ncbi:MAG: hypothetical protein WA752_27660, partial [Mycobacterium sp.]
MPPKRDAPHPRAICVYCASGPTHPELLALAAELGGAIADRGWTLVWGGGNVSAMGALATAARARGAWTVGVIPTMLVRREVADTDADITETGRPAELLRAAQDYLTVDGAQQLFVVDDAHHLDHLS